MMYKYVCAAVCAVLLSGCIAFKAATRFSDEKVVPGMTKKEFVAKFGKPYNRSFFTEDGVLYETLFYKEEMHTGAWFIVTTAFHFEDSRLVGQEIVNEERTYQRCDNQEKK